MTPEELQSGRVFHGRYEIIRCIQAGGMGAVYEVVHLETKRRRALKVMLPSIVRDESMRSRFRMEAQITADVESDHIVETFDAGVDPETGAPFLVMELLRGEDLAQHVRARGRMEAEEVAGVLHQLSRALEQTHACGIIHRDLKPENLFLAARGDDPPRLKVLDFGIAKIMAQSSAQNGTTSVGTPLYMAPEQFAGAEVSAATDLFAVGHIAFALLTGESYWSEEAASIALMPLFERLARGAEESPCARAARKGVTLPPAFDAWFRRSTARTPADRFERAREQADALAEALGVSSVAFKIPRASSPAPASALPRKGVSPEAQTAPAAEALAATSLSAGADPAEMSARGEAIGTSPMAQTGGVSVRTPRDASTGGRARAIVVAAVVLAAAASATLFFTQNSARSGTAGASATARSPEPTVLPITTAPSATTAASEPQPRVEPAPSAPASSTASASASPPKAAPPPAVPKPPKPPKRDPTKVFE